MKKKEIVEIIQNSKTIGELLEKVKKKISPNEYKLFEALFYASDLRKTDSLVCYGSVAYCCGLEKKCPLRNFLLATKGVSPAFYVGCKQELDKIFWQFFNDPEKRRIMEKLGATMLKNS